MEDDSGSDRLTLPNFLVIRAAKSGTTSLYYYLKQHPQIYMNPTKEPSLFAFVGIRPVCYGPWKKWAARNAITDIRAYRALFHAVTDEVVIGEASPVSLVHPRAPERTKHYTPHAKLIAIPRNPADRAYSAYAMRALYTGEPFDFAQVVRGAKNVVQEYNSTTQPSIDVGFYHAHLKRYLDLFDRSQIQVHLYEDLETDPPSILQDIFCFLGVDETLVPDLSVQHMVGGIPRNRRWSVMIMVLDRAKPLLRRFVPAFSSTDSWVARLATAQLWEANYERGNPRSASHPLNGSYG